MARAVILLGVLMLAHQVAVAPEVPPAVRSLAQQPKAPAPPAAPAPPPDTDIHEIAFDGRLESLQQGTVAPVAAETGYENQPFYTPDGAALLFTASRDGKQTDIYEFDRKARRERQLVSTPEAEYSPTITPDGKGFSVIRVEADSTQRLWRFDRDGSNPRLLLADVKPVGYHAWIDADQLALFVLGPPATLQHARVSSGKAAVIATDIGRSVHRIPGTRLVSFVQREAGNALRVKQLDPATGTVTPLVQLHSGSGDGDIAWTPDGILLSSAGTKIHAWRRGNRGWREVLDVAALKLGAVTRMAVAPDGRALAIVVNATR